MAALGRQLAVPPNRITEILNGQRAIIGDTAPRLGHFFGISPQSWLNLQTIYDLHMTEQKTGAVIKTFPTLNASWKKHDSNQSWLA